VNETLVRHFCLDEVIVPVVAIPCILIYAYFNDY
jgi:hypothetical protein